MRTWREIFQFELRQQLKSPFALAVLLIFFLIHFLSVTSTGISLWARPLANINSTYAIAVTETTLAIFGMLPVGVFVAKAILRDYDAGTTALIFAKPIGKRQYLWGRFSAACLLAALAGLTGLLGSLVGTLMPWLDQERLAPFSLEPFLFGYFAIVLPNMLIQSALFFSVACLTRSLAATVALAMLLFVGDLVIANFWLNANSGNVAVLADHSATLLVAAATRNLTIPELNTLWPQTLLPENRLLWLAIAFSILGFSFNRFRFDRSEGPLAYWLRRKKTMPAGARVTCPEKFADRVEPTYPTSSFAMAQFASQARVDLIYLLRSPLFLLILVLGAVSTASEYSAHVGQLMSAPLHPVTSVMLGFFRYGLAQFVLIIAIYYSGALVHREREAGVAEIVDASPFPGWIPPLSKTFALCVVVALLLTVSMLTSIAIQALNGHTNFELGLYLRTVFLHNGFYFWMLCVLAILVQVAIANKWLGMLALLVAYVALLTLDAFGFEHVLYSFAIPYAIYSDMNGFDHVGWQIHSLIAYWSCFCGLLLLVAHLLYARGVHASHGERIRSALRKLDKQVAAFAAIFAAGFIGMGSWIFYNTNVLNTYTTNEDSQRAQAAYETAYGRYENRPTPSFDGIDIAMDVFPEERRLDSKGSAILRNKRDVEIDEFVISVDPKMRVAELYIDAAKPQFADVAQGLYLYKLDTPLRPGQSVAMKWNLSRASRGFANSRHDTEIVRNGTFVNTGEVMPIPVFNGARKLDDNATRKKFGLKPTARLPELGDPEYLDDRAIGLGGSDFRVVMSTADDQVAVAPGQLKREWRENRRRYFEYVSERPIPPLLAFTSARYEIARDRWHDVALEVYYDPKHAYNVEAMLTTAKRSLDYFTREFSPYQFSYFRIVEYPRYRTAAKAFVGLTAYSEAVGFVSDLSAFDNIDYTTVHELSHMWWGGQAAGAKMQGRELLNETLAQYSTLMVFEKNSDAAVLNRILGRLQRDYLRARSQDDREELPLMRTDDQGHISYNKGALAMYALRESLGEEAVNRALRNYLAKFADKPPPFPTSRDLVNELRAVAAPEFQSLITDLFEKIVLYDIELTQASAARIGEGYEVTLIVSGHQFEAGGRGEETEVPLHGWFDVVLFPHGERPLETQKPLYLGKHLLRSGANTIVVRIAAKPAYASVDPFHKMADRRPDNNGRTIEAK